MKFSVEATKDEGLRLESGDLVVSLGYCPIAELMAGNLPYTREFGRAIGSLMLMIADARATMSDREYLQGCIDAGVRPRPGTYVLDAPLVVSESSPPGPHDWGGVVLTTNEGIKWKMKSL